jgi:hypothetical protein
MNKKNEVGIDEASYIGKEEQNVHDSMTKSKEPNFYKKRNYARARKNITRMH